MSTLRTQLRYTPGPTKSQQKEAKKKATKSDINTTATATTTPTNDCVSVDEKKILIVAATNDDTKSEPYYPFCEEGPLSRRANVTCLWRCCRASYHHGQHHMVAKLISLGANVNANPITYALSKSKLKGDSFIRFHLFDSVIFSRFLQPA
jgi:hypothetical protein